MDFVWMLVPNQGKNEDLEKQFGNISAKIVCEAQIPDCKAEKKNFSFISISSLNCITLKRQISKTKCLK